MREGNTAMQPETVTCPHCGQRIDVNEIVYHQLEDKLTKEFNARDAQRKKEISEQLAALDKQREELSRSKQELAGTIEDEVATRIKAATEDIRVKAREEASRLQAEAVKELQRELAEKSAQAKELYTVQAALERLKREKDELKGVIEAESEKKLTETLHRERDKIRKEIEDRSLLKLSEKEMLIDQLRTQLTEAQRKMEQGSTQVQGEAQELVIEEWLRTAYPLDTIEEIKKGALGADCLQTVNTRTRLNCGTIYYESKRTKGFQPAWIEKFKNDIREKKADIGVLVTETMPADMSRMGLKSGVWVCGLHEFKGLCAVLRETLIQIAAISSARENIGSKMELLYDYLTGTEFRQQVEAIVEGFTQMQEDLQSEKRAIQQRWKKREKQLEKVLLSTTTMYGSVKGIAGDTIGSVKQLDFDDEDEPDTTETG
jgi:hypothetical protein